MTKQKWNNQLCDAQFICVTWAERQIIPLNITLNNYGSEVFPVTLNKYRTNKQPSSPHTHFQIAGWHGLASLPSGAPQKQTQFPDWQIAEDIRLQFPFNHELRYRIVLTNTVCDLSLWTVQQLAVWKSLVEGKKTVTERAVCFTEGNVRLNL